MCIYIIDEKTCEMYDEKKGKSSCIVASSFFWTLLWFEEEENCVRGISSRQRGLTWFFWNVLFGCQAVRSPNLCLILKKMRNSGFTK